MTINALWILIGVLAIYAIAYRYYSAFIAAKVLTLNDARITPAHRLNDGNNFTPTNKYVLWGHHFAAISDRQHAAIRSGGSATNSNAPGIGP